MDEQIKEELKQCKNLNSMWLILNKYYDMNKELGMLGKSAVINNIHLLIKATGTKTK